MKTNVVALVLFYSSIVYSSTPSSTSNIKTCLSSREYITTVKFLRDKKEYQLTQEQIKKTADLVSKGCSGSSQQFIKIMKLLTKMGIDSGSSLNTALNFVNKEKSFAKAFIEIFRQTYDPSYLDLDALSAMKISLQLSAQYKGDVEKSLTDFSSLVQYCLENKSMELPNARCAQLATKITMLGQEYEESISKPFIELMSFLQEDDNGPKFDKNTSLKISESVLKYGPLAEKNFRQAYIFAMSKEGLSYDLKMAIPFAKEMAKRSVMRLKSIK
jgi:hypothetical protein